MGTPEGAHEEEDQGHCPRPHQALCRPSTREGIRLQPRQLHAARTGGQLPLRGHARPAASHQRGEGRHGTGAAHGPPGVRRRGLRKDRGGHPRGLQGCHRRQAGGRDGAHHRAGLSALPDLPVPTEGHARARGLPVAGAQCQADQGRAAGLGRGKDRHHHRHTQAHRQDREVPRPGTAHHRRGAEVRRGREGESCAR